MSTPVAGALAVTPLYATSADAIVSWDDPGQTWRSLAYLASPATIALTGDVTGSGTTAIACAVVRLQGRPLAATLPTSNQVIQWSGTQWAPATLAVSGGTVTSISAGGGITVSPSPIVGVGTVSLTVPVAIANGGTGTTSAFTAGSVVFAGAGGAYAQDNLNLFWDDGNNRLGIGTTTPRTTLDVGGSIRATSRVIPSAGLGLEAYLSSGAGGIEVYDRTAGAYGPLTLSASQITLAIGNVGIGTASPGQKLDVAGNGNFAGSLTAANGFVASYGSIAAYYFQDQANPAGLPWMQLYLSSGTAAFWQSVGGAWFYMRSSDWLIWNQKNALGGYGAYANLSDERSKTDIAVADVGLAEVLQIVPISYSRLPVEVPVGDEGETRMLERPPDIGFSAQQVQNVIPEAVMVMGIELPDGTGGLADANPTLGVTSETITAALVNAVKELHARVAALEKPL